MHAVNVDVKIKSCWLLFVCATLWFIYSQSCASGRVGAIIAHCVHEQNWLE